MFKIGSASPKVTMAAGVSRAMKKRFAAPWIFEMIEGYYDRSWNCFMEPREKFQLPDSMVAILAGELEGGWKLDWRRRSFSGWSNT